MAVLARIVTMAIMFIQSYVHWPENGGATNDTTKSLGHLAGLILARAGSKGIPNKNRVELNGQPLIHWALNAMIKSGVFTTIWISTDDHILVDWIRRNHYGPGVKVHWRAAYTATDEATSMMAVKEFLSQHAEIDTIGLVQATSPLIQAKYLVQAVTVLNGSADSVFSVTRSHKLRWKPVSNPVRDSTAPLNFDVRTRPRRQDWAGEMIENGMFYFSTRDLIMNHNVFQGKKSSYVEIAEEHSVEVDTFQHLRLASWMMNDYNTYYLPPQRHEPRREQRRRTEL